MSKVLYIFTDDKVKNVTSEKDATGNVVDDIQCKSVNSVKTEDLAPMLFSGSYVVFVLEANIKQEETALRFFDNLRMAVPPQFMPFVSFIYKEDLSEKHIESEKRKKTYDEIYTFYHRKKGDIPANRECVIRLLNVDSKKKLPKDLIDNYATILENDSTLKDRFRFNIIREDFEIKDKWWNEDADTTPANKQTDAILSDCGYAHIARYFSANYELESLAKIVSALHTTAKRYNPVAEKLNSLVWDGRDRFKECLTRLLGCKKDWYSFVVLSMTMFGYVNRCFNPGCDFQLVPVLYGPQGVGKGAFCSYFALGDSNLYTTIDPETMYKNEKDTGEKLAGVTIAEIEEGAVSDAGEKIKKVKGFISRRSDKFRAAYARGNAINHKRGCIFIMTSNDEYPLPADSTGARRYMSIRCDDKNVDPTLSAKTHYTDANAYFEQVIAQAVYMYKQGRTVTAIPVYAIDFCKLFMDEKKAEKYIEENGMPEMLRSEIEKMQMSEQPYNGLKYSVQAFLDECKTVNCVCVDTIIDLFNSLGVEKTSDSQRKRKASAIMKEMEGWSRADSPKHCGAFTAKNSAGDLLSEYGKNGHFRSYGTQRVWIRNGSTGTNNVIEYGSNSSKIINYQAEAKKIAEANQQYSFIDIDETEEEIPFIPMVANS